jgi:hypothetical protein
MAVTRGALEALRRKHHVSVDCWYSCPLSADGCCDESRHGCNCAAEAHNARLDIVIAELFPSALSPSPPHG